MTSKMNRMQKRAVEIALAGHNMLLTGAGGSGKTFVMKEVIKQLKGKQKTVSVTASTGMASTCYKEFSATTLHKWCGIGTQYRNRTDQEIVDDILGKSDCSKIKETDVLVIDEIGMVSAKTFKLVEFICRTIRQSSYYFGGVQILLTGSFTQLPPVPNKASNDTGEYCFETDIFQNAVSHHVHLTDMMRQQDKELATLVQELEAGAPSEKSEELLNTLQRPVAVPEGEKATVLLGTNFAVDCYNQERIHEMNGELRSYRAIDAGKQINCNSNTRSMKVIGIFVLSKGRNA